jgi:hypothetical protein
MKQQNGNSNGNREISYPQELRDIIKKSNEDNDIDYIEKDKNLIMEFDRTKGFVLKIDYLNKKLNEQKAKLKEQEAKLNDQEVILTEQVAKLAEQVAKLTEINISIIESHKNEPIKIKQDFYLWWNLIIHSKLLSLIIITIILDISGLIFFSNTGVGFAMIFGSTLLLYEIFYVTFKKSRNNKIINHNE